MKSLNAASVLPEDGTAGTLVGRVWLPSASGPAVVAVRGDGVFDVTSTFPTVSALAEEAQPAAALGKVAGTRIGSLDDMVDENAGTAWASEIAQRIAEIDQGKVQIVPWAEVRHRLSGE